MPPWGPDRRPAAVAVAFAGLATPAPDHPVTPALPTLLRVLSDRQLYATFFVEPEIATAEPFALEMIDLSANEVGLLADTTEPDALADGFAALRDAGAQPAGALLTAGAGEPGGSADTRQERAADAGATDADAPGSSHPGATDAAADALRAAGAAYVALPGGAPAARPTRGDDGLVRIPVARDEAASPSSFHLAFQAAVGRTLPLGGMLAIAPPAHRFERRDALDVLVESLDLVAGLRRAERLWTPTFAELASEAAAQAG
ncbi:hypothetical protein [Conexibacter arvalis]|uniref:Uncharacterized protein n=1 Tax=Conexibacter arvalis TaxID=912552 RepID=A0A840I8Y3_9ACTN|nr:hypothetical protein [Conexibacter arvalis]MBB4661326.1 hypothetical protein [Conexibacter arvalis]